jgi:hypothetical protein
MANSMTVDGPEMTEIRKAARELGIWVVLGYSERQVCLGAHLTTLTLAKT